MSITTHETLSTHEALSTSRPLRGVDAIYRSPGLHWVGDGFRVVGYFSAIPDAARRLDPFVLLDYHPTYEYTPTTKRRGVGPHPHRGFETVTIAFQGSVAHHDSTGAGGIIGPGDVQWMTAASGILHKEYHEEEYGRRGGPFQVAQLWVNLPAAHKMDAPHYQPLLASEMGLATLPGGAGEVRVIAGEYQGAKGPARTYSPMHIYDARLTAGGRMEMAFAARDNAALLVMSGAVTVNGERARKDEFVLFKNEGERIVVEAVPEEAGGDAAGAQLLVLAGEPIGEPVVQYGPFVMNTEEEIVTAYRDFRAGKFGHLED